MSVFLPDLDDDDPPGLDPGSSDDDDDEEAFGQQSSDSNDDSPSAEVVPVSATDTSDYPSTASDSNLEVERRYRGTPTRTKLLQFERLRIPKKRVRTEVPYVAKKKQARDGLVKAFHPRIYSQCCVRRCCKYFDDPEAPLLVLARKPLFDETLTRADMRDRLQRNAVDLLKHPDDGKPVCSKMACIAYSCSTSLLYPNHKRTLGDQGDSNRRRAKAMFSVMAWFAKEKELCDIMPDTGKFLFCYPRRHAVYERYINDCNEATACSDCPLGRNPLARGPCGCPSAQQVYLKVSEPYFKTLWGKHFNNCQIRKHQRFSKCSFCVKWRGVRNNRKLDKAERLEAKQFLTGHYDWVARERAAEIHKVTNRCSLFFFAGGWHPHAHPASI